MLIDSNYYHLFGQIDLPDTFILKDHHKGYDKDLRNVLFDKIKSRQHTIITHTVIDEQVKKNYPHLHFKFSADMQDKLNLGHFKNYKKHPIINYNNFVCSFNGTNHVSRHLLSSILENQGYFNPHYSSKNFAINEDKILGHLNYLDLTENEIELYDKFFKSTDEFNNTVYSFGHARFAHADNIYNLDNKITQCFLHIVSETMATSHHPFVTEKFLYSIVTRGLFVCYAQPGWHAHIKKYYGFKLYDKIFDYSFDCIQNPVKRLIKLIEMISKFSKLSADDWRSLYHVLEKDTVEYNYDHYFSGNYFRHMKQFDKTGDS